MKVKDLTQEI